MLRSIFIPVLLFSFLFIKLLSIFVFYHFFIHGTYIHIQILLLFLLFFRLPSFCFASFSLLYTFHLYFRFSYFRFTMLVVFKNVRHVSFKKTQQHFSFCFFFSLLFFKNETKQIRNRTKELNKIKKKMV